ncbi:5'/3'-nucleotidase SurE [Gayadomonas joobiniege]|uniref:5'/3'-nucleotidase SurE n=1 Tax=Gayadomonas joobiniege TaxID=1234606 RepID=UPI000474F324|nr:5'/3'-nucleotidase SurE [Gayadomonas joobiniege]
MKILLSNDDGVHSSGLKALYQALKKDHQVTVCAPDRNCSGASNSLTLSNPLRVQRLDNGFFMVYGTPTDCVHLAINQLMDEKPDIVVSGINHGANLGDDVLYSGTVAAATEGRHMGLPAIAVSQNSHRPTDFSAATKVVLKLLDKLSEHPLPADQILNVNVPDIPVSSIKGIQTTRCGRRHQAGDMQKATDPFGHEIYWYGPIGEIKDAAEGSDFYALANEYIAVTPLTVDMTAYKSVALLEPWLQQITL